MSDSRQNRVTVRVEVVVDGATTTVQAGHINHRIYTPKPSLQTPNTPVRIAGGLKYVESTGQKLSTNGDPAFVVRAQAYPSVLTDVLTNAAYDTPPVGAATDIPLDDGSWSFTVAKSNDVPGAACDDVDGGPDNSTIIVWYAFPGQTAYSREFTAFHGYCPAGSGSGSHVGPASLPMTLFANFTGDLAALGTVTLTFNGTSWLGVASGLGGFFLTFFFGDPDCTLTGMGGPGSFVVTRAATSLNPFFWAGEGSIDGFGAGLFGVNLTQ
jgi:hypothetical protein